VVGKWFYCFSFGSDIGNETKDILVSLVLFFRPRGVNAICGNLGVWQDALLEKKRCSN
jgi:hypothetical protein